MVVRPPAILVTSYGGDPGTGKIRLEAAAGRRPRKDYVELADRTGGLVIDHEHIVERGRRASRAIARCAGLPAAQVTEAFLLRDEHDGTLAWADRLGLPLALLAKLTRSRPDLVMVSVALSSPKKAIPLQRLRLHTHFAAIVTKGTAQLEIAASRLGVPREKLHLGVHAVDELFWTPRSGDASEDGPIVAVGWEERDYATLLRAASGLDLPFELAIGSIAAPNSTGVSPSPLGELTTNVRLHANLSFVELRELYARARFVVVPLKDVEFDAGVTAIAEAMAMGKAVVVSKTRGQRDLLRDGQQGRYVPPGDPGALREVIERLADDEAATADMGRAGRALIERRHTLDRYVGELADLLNDAVASARAHS